MPGLVDLLNRLPKTCQPAFIRGDCDWGNNPVMTKLEEMGQKYLFKLKGSERVKELIAKVHGLGQWTRFNDDWEIKESTLKLSGWGQSRRVAVIRRQVKKNKLLGIGCEKERQLEVTFVDKCGDMRLFEYSVHHQS